MPNDPIAAILARLREEMIAAANVLLPGLSPEKALAAGALHGAALNALAGLEEALKFHERRPLYGNASTEDEPGACPHDPDSPLHFEDGYEPGEWLCGEKHEADACSGCAGSPDGEYADWPCAEYDAILAALTGKGNDGG